MARLMRRMPPPMKVHMDGISPYASPTHKGPRSTSSSMIRPASGPGISAGAMDRAKNNAVLHAEPITTPQTNCHIGCTPCGRMSCPATVLQSSRGKRTPRAETTIMFPSGAILPAYRTIVMKAAMDMPVTRAIQFPTSSSSFVYFSAPLLPKITGRKMTSIEATEARSARSVRLATRSPRKRKPKTAAQRGFMAMNNRVLATEV
mmetsp:Transcript_66100/g.116990  ORF Transcript_66100/g.116990 Transcript_66100/m.116990 type:complete len:204 (+) Transcript_66100:93-704(+)